MSREGDQGRAHRSIEVAPGGSVRMFDARSSGMSTTDLGVVVHEVTVDRLEQAADLAARKMLRMYDALFVQMAIERKLPLLTADVKLSNAAGGLVKIELLAGAQPT